MNAAVLHTLGKPPRFEQFPDPDPGENEVLVHVRAANPEGQGEDQYGGEPW